MTAIGPATTIRLESKAQLDRHRKAAKTMKWSIRRFYLEAADRFAENILASEKPIEQLIVKSDQPSLNQ